MKNTLNVTQSISPLWHSLLGVCLLLPSLAWSAESHQSTNTPAATYDVKKSTQPNWFALEATIEAVNEATISAQTSGRIQSIAVDVNDYVSQGQLLIQLRNKQQKAAFDRASAQLKQAQALNQDAQAKKQRSLPVFKQGGISKSQFDSIKAQAASTAAAVKASQALLKQAKEQLSYTEIRAPYAGIVKARHVQVGESVNPGSRLMTGLSLNELRAVADIPQRFAPHIKGTSSDYKIQIISGTQVIEGHKTTLFPYADKQSHSFKVRVDFNSENTHLFPGMWVKLNVPMGEKTTLLVPSTSVMQKGELSSVYVMTANGPKQRQVRLGHKVNNQINILAGLREGETIATDAYGVLAGLEK